MRAPVPSSRAAAIRAAREIALEVIASWSEHLRAPDPMRQALVTARVEQLLHYLMSVFCGEITLGEVQKICLEAGDHLSSAYLEQLRPAAIPLAVMRAILKSHEIAFDVRGAPSWAIFAERYGEHILAINTDRSRPGDHGPSPAA
jgi:hypothetical protein